ncbi:MAG: hypothetical protein AAF458_10885 [Pseudomonadota bacterium]
MKALAYSGHLTDSPDRSRARLPEARVGDLRSVVRSGLKRLAPDVVIGSAARGVDLLILEAAMALGITAEIVLPFTKEVFRALSVEQPTVPDWSNRFDAALEYASTVHLLSGASTCAEAVSFELANRVILGRLAKLAESGVDSDIMAVWDGQPGDGAGGTASFLALAQDSGFGGSVACLANAATDIDWRELGALTPGQTSAQADGFGVVFEVAGAVLDSATEVAGARSLFRSATDAETAVLALSSREVLLRPVVCRPAAWPDALDGGIDEKEVVWALAALERRHLAEG